MKNILLVEVQYVIPETLTQHASANKLTNPEKFSGEGDRITENAPGKSGK